jgi:hypothetical protein
MNWRPSRRTEQLYAQELIRFFERLLERSVREGIPIQLLEAAEFVNTYARQIALRMVSALYFAGARTWREAALKAGHGRAINRALQTELQGPVGRRVQELVRENARLITSLPAKVAVHVAARAAAQQYAGGRAAELVPPLLKRTVRWRAKLIARTEVSKASTALTRARSEELGIDWAIWETSQDERVRKSHRKMQGVIYRFNVPPSPEQLVGERSTLGHYNAGDAPNDRCYPAPLVRLEQVSWPHRIYYAGRIQYMTLSQFRRINSVKEVAA